MVVSDLDRSRPELPLAVRSTSDGNMAVTGHSVRYAEEWQLFCRERYAIDPYA